MSTLFDLICYLFGLAIAAMILSFIMCFLLGASSSIKNQYQAQMDWCSNNGGEYFYGWNAHCEFAPKKHDR